MTSPPMERDSYVISVRDLRVDYDDCIALRDVTFHVKRGEIYGLIGPNGAGKTTTLRVLATLLEPTYGNVTISGVDILTDPKPIRPILGTCRTNLQSTMNFVFGSTLTCSVLRTE